MEMKRQLRQTIAVGLLLPSLFALSLEVRANTYRVSPFQLVGLAYDGYLTEQGIPRAYSLIKAIRSGRIQAEDVVQAGVVDGRLSADALQDRGYLVSVDDQLKALKDIGDDGLGG